MEPDGFRLDTPRLLLRVHREEDAPFMVRLNSDPEVVRYVGDGPLDPAKARELIAGLRRQFRERGLGRLIVVEKATGEPVGWCGLKLLDDGVVDLGYRFLRDRWGRGYATEAGAAALAYGFETLGLREIRAHALAPNEASFRVMRKLGMAEARRGEDVLGPFAEYRVDPELFARRPLR